MNLHLAAPCLTRLATEAARLIGSYSETVTEVPARVALNPFGFWFTAATWLALLSLNAWCFWRLLGSGAGRGRLSSGAP